MRKYLEPKIKNNNISKFLDAGTRMLKRKIHFHLWLL